jgi:alkaline phosphatase D
MSNIIKAVITFKANPSLFDNTDYYLQLSTSENFEFPISSDVRSKDSFGIVKFTINNLNEDTTYYVRALTSLGLLVSKNLSRFRTQKLNPHSFKFGFASCSQSNSTEASNARIYDNIANKAINNELDFFVHLGDIHYRDIATNNETDFQIAFDDVFKSPRQNNCWRNLPMYYMWDDHDYGPNDTDKNNPSRQAAIAAYRRRVPNPLLAKSGVEDAPYYSFVRGRVRFIVTDIRSEREPKGTYPSTDTQQQVFSSDQKQWFFNEMLTAKNSGQIIIWANTKPWVSSTGNGKDDWGGYHAARLEIVNFINQHNLENRIVIISGDMHALAYDNGSSSNNFGNLKVCHAAALDQTGSSKGGPYTLGPIRVPPSGNVTQYGVIEVTDNNNININIRFKGIVVDQVTSAESIAIDVNFDLFP